MKFKNEKPRKGACYNGNKGQFAKKMSQEAQLQEQVQRFFTCDYRRQDWIIFMIICLSWQFIKIIELHDVSPFGRRCFQPLRNMICVKKNYVEDNNPNIDVSEKCTIVFKQPNGISKCIEYIFYIKYVFYNHNM